MSGKQTFLKQEVHLNAMQDFPLLSEVVPSKLLQLGQFHRCSPGVITVEML